MANPGPRGLTRILKAAGYSLQGLAACYRNEEAFRQETWLAAVLVPLGFYLGVTPLEKALLASTVLLVLIIELLNSSLESVVDRVSSDHHELSGRAKDMGSAAVLLALVNVLVVWGFLLVPRLLVL